MQEQVTKSMINGTLAIDLGSSTTVVAFQPEKNDAIKLLDLESISRSPGEVPSLLWQSPENENIILYGQEVENLNIKDKESPFFISDFKRWIGAPQEDQFEKSKLLPEEAGELLIRKIWEKIPSNFNVKRLVLTAPVETYKSYRKWLNKVCSNLNVKEIALVDEPTAAAIGANQKGGSKLLVIDIGGSTIDMSMVLLEGGEGYADPIAQLIRFDGKDLEGKSQQVLRCAKVLGKAGLRLGGRDIDRWIANSLFPDIKQSYLILNSAEKLKCKLSDTRVSDTKTLSEEAIINEAGHSVLLKLRRIDLEDLLENKGLIASLQKLLDKTLARGRANGCELDDLNGIVLVGGGSQLPLIKKWLAKQVPASKFLTPPPIEAVALGALKLTPGVTVKDVLNKGVSIQCWDQKTNSHIWHPIFLPGQPWPTNKPMEIILAASKKNQLEIDIKIADYDVDEGHEVIYINGIPTIKELLLQPKFINWSSEVNSIRLDPPGDIGEDCLKVRFSIDDCCQLNIEGIDIRNNETVINEELGIIR